MDIRSSPQHNIKTFHITIYNMRLLNNFITKANKIQGVAKQNHEKKFVICSDGEIKYYYGY